MNGLFDKTFSLLGNTLDLRAAKHKLITSNIANQETPGYKAVDINFEDELRKRTGGLAPGVTLASTNSMHLGGTYTGVSEPTVTERATDLEGFDRNSVGIETEMVKLSENTLMYSIASKMLRSKFVNLMTAIKEGGK